MEKIIVFDTTLRDGEQSPGASMSVRQKLEFAHQLQRLKVDIIEAGFPISSKAQFEACKLIAAEVKKPVIAGLARAVKPDIDAVYNSLKKAAKPRIHTFIATSDIHMKHKLNKNKSEVLKMAVEGVKYACSLCKDVEFSAEDATRSTREFLAEIVQAVIEAGASTINIPDTVGYTTPEEFHSLILYLKENVTNINEICLSVHCHNDLGLGVANSLSALYAGARQVECSVNGIGERAGNASLEEIVMSLKTRKDFYNLDSKIDTKEIYKTSRLLTHITGMYIQANKAIVGKNAFSHEAGIHQHGMVKNRNTYEIMTPESIGRTESGLVLGRHSGKHGFSKKLDELKISLDKKDFEKVYDEFTKIADKKKQIFDEDLLIIIQDVLDIKNDFCILDYVSVTTGTGTIPTATIRIKKNGELIQEASCGDGPVDAVYKAIDRIMNSKLVLKNYEIKAVTSGKDAIGEVVITLEKDKKEITGHGYSTDIIEASAKAYINAINIYHRIINNHN